MLLGNSEETGYVMTLRHLPLLIGFAPSLLFVKPALCDLDLRMDRKFFSCLSFPLTSRAEVLQMLFPSEDL
jgi:hypothetical protein